MLRHNQIEAESVRLQYSLTHNEKDLIGVLATTRHLVSTAIERKNAE